VAARNDMQPGQLLRDGDVRVVNYGDQFLPDAVLHRRERVVGRWTTSPIAKGEFVLPTKISPEPPEDSLSARNSGGNAGGSVVHE